MPKASTSDIEIAQRACVVAGIDKISNFDDTDSEVAIVLNDIYEDIITDCLTIHPWRFATFTEPLGPPLVTPPAVNYQTAYAVPTVPAPLQIRTLYVGGALVSRYRLMGSELWVDSKGSDEAELEALWRLNESQWPPWFRLYAIEKVAAFLCSSITRNGELAKTFFDEAAQQLALARSRDSMQQTTQKMHLTKIRSTRMGGRPL